jgi:hypothetical protein
VNTENGNKVQYLNISTKRIIHLIALTNSIHEKSTLVKRIKVLVKIKNYRTNHIYPLFNKNSQCFGSF